MYRSLCDWELLDLCLCDGLRVLKGDVESSSLVLSPILVWKSWYCSLMAEYYLDMTDVSGEKVSLNHTNLILIVAPPPYPTVPPLLLTVVSVLLSALGPPVLLSPGSVLVPVSCLVFLALILCCTLRLESLDYLGS